MSLGDRVRTARELRKLSQNELEKRAQLSVGYVSRLEAGLRANRQGITETTLLKLASALSVRRAWLLDGNGPMEEATDTEQLPHRAEAIRIAREGRMSEDVIESILAREVPNAETRSVLWWLEEMFLSAMARSRNHEEPVAPKTSPPRSKIRRKIG